MARSNLPKRSKLTISTAEQEMLSELQTMYADPLTFVKYAFPWGEKGTVLEHESIDRWQEDMLNEIGERVYRRYASQTDGRTKEAKKYKEEQKEIERAEHDERPWEGQDDLGDVIRIAMASGTGPGKTALISMILIWHIATREAVSDVVTANTSSQLSTKTWRELQKWHGLFIAKKFFTWTATKYYSNLNENSFIAAIPWSENNPDAFRGTHEQEVLYVFDEASNIADCIWDSANTTMTTGNCIFLAFSNPTRNDGGFRECFRKFRHRWITKHLDSRTARKTNKAEIQRWIDDYGIDSDYVKTKVLGQFPRVSSMQFISGDLADLAMARIVRPEEYRHAPIVIGVDVARFGDDQSVIAVRQGLKLISLEAYRELSTMKLASLVALKINEVRPDGVFVDAVGVGAGVVDRLTQLGHSIYDVVGGATAGDAKYFNKRAECWGNMRDWLKYADIPKDQELFDDLTGPEYGFSDKFERIQLEKKEDMKNRGLPSPDKGDAIALTFAEHVIARGSRGYAYGVDYESDADYDYGDTLDTGAGRDPVTGY